MTRLQEELIHLKESLNQMSFLVINQLSKSIDSLTRFDKDLAQEVIRNEKRVNAMEIDIDKKCESIFTLMTPVAKDMRFVFSSLKINTDLERIADYAENIAFMVMELKRPFEDKLLEELQLKKMSDTALIMLADTITAYGSENADMARGVFTNDFIIDDIKRKAQFIIATQIKKDLDNIIDYMDLWSVIRRVERVGDHITNVAEEIIFHIEATVIKHSEKSPSRKPVKKSKPKPGTQSDL